MFKKEKLDLVILAAGIGSRIQKPGKEIPKCLLPINRTQTILSRQLEQFLSQDEIARIIISSGYSHGKIEEYLDRHFRAEVKNARLVLEYNPFYMISNNLISLWNIRGLILQSSRALLISNGDNIYGRTINNLLTELPEGNVLFTRIKDEYDGDDMKIRLKNGNIIQVNKNISGKYADGEAIGLAKFNQAGKLRLFKILSELVENPHHLNSFYLRAFEHLIKQGSVQLKPYYCGNMFFDEIDFPEDYARLLKAPPE